MTVWLTVAALSLVFGLPAAARAAEVWPGSEWETATPESQGLDPRGVEEAADLALRHGGGSGCVIRFGRLVKEWGPVDRLADI